MTGTRVALATIHFNLHRQLGLSLVKTRPVHPLQLDTDQADYICQIPCMPSKYLFYIGEHSFWSSILAIV